MTDIIFFNLILVLLGAFAIWIVHKIFEKHKKEVIEELIAIIEKQFNETCKKCKQNNSKRLE